MGAVAISGARLRWRRGRHGRDTLAPRVSRFPKSHGPMTFNFHPDNTIPSGDWIWVFGANEAGKHGKGSARVAHVNFRAEYGAGHGPTGQAYGIPTQGRHLQALPLTRIELSVADFLAYANVHPQLNFFVSRVACTASGATVSYTDAQIAPLFDQAPRNGSLPERWRPYVNQARVQPLTSTVPALPASAGPRSRCPFCGHWTFADQIEAPLDYCHHEVLRSA